MVLRFEAELLIPGRGKPLRDGVVVIDGTTILYAGPSATSPSPQDSTTVRTHTIMPGMWDCHGHFSGVRFLDFARLPLEPIALRAARITGDLRAALDAGITSVREVGGLGVYVAKAIAEGCVVGPNVYAAGSIISTTGGHGDLHSIPLPWMEDFDLRGGELRLADGPAECLKAVREQLRKNAKIIKICASGGMMSEVDDPAHQQFTDVELRTMVEAAGMAERAVAAHCHGKAGIMAALAAGVSTIEHGSHLDEEAAAAMRHSGAILVSTRTIAHDLLETDSTPPHAKLKLAKLVDRHAAAIALARESGVIVAMGTDVALSGVEFPVSWGRNGRELPLLAQCGFSSLEAIEAATANGPATLGLQAPRSGQLKAGYDADILTLAADPLADLSILAEPANITGVWKAGVRVKPYEAEHTRRPV